MNCPKCNSSSIGVADTFQSEKETYRVKKCKDCGFKFYTKEEIKSDDEVKPIFTRWTNERVKKLRAKGKGEEYEPEFKSETSSAPKKPTSPLF